MTWPGVIAHFRDRLSVTAETPVVTLLEGNTQPSYGVRCPIRPVTTPASSGPAACPTQPARWFGSSAPADVVLELKRVYRLVERLPPDLRLVFLLRRIEGLSHEEVTETAAEARQRFAGLVDALLPRLAVRD